MKKYTYLFIFCFIFEYLNASTIDGLELKQRITNWLKSNGADTKIEILDNIKYPYCKDKDFLISDISGAYRLIKVSCLGENKWSLLLEINKNLNQKIMI